MNKTKIEWCDSTWNPVTGCLHDCEYCYARGIAKRFGGWNVTPGCWHFNVAEDKTFICTGKSYYGDVQETKYGKIADINAPFLIIRNRKEPKAPYPFGFMPTFHRYRLTDINAKQPPKTIFVCSMADLFGDWVPDDWIKDVFAVCAAAPQHRYLFLTKNPKRYNNSDWLPYSEDGEDVNAFFGASVTNNEQLREAFCSGATWISVEPLLENLNLFEDYALDVSSSPRWQWVRIGAETGNRKNKTRPEREWIQNIVDVCRRDNIPVFMKDSLADIWGGPLIREFPWD